MAKNTLILSEDAAVIKSLSSTKLNRAEKRIARSIRKGSSRNVVKGGNGVRI